MTRTDTFGKTGERWQEVSPISEQYIDLGGDFLYFSLIPCLPVNYGDFFKTEFTRISILPWLLVKTDFNSSPILPEKQKFGEKRQKTVTIPASFSLFW